MPNDPSLLRDGASDRLHVVNKASIQFVETGQMAEDTWDIDWETTPEEPAPRAAAPPPAPRPRAATPAPQPRRELERRPAAPTEAPGDRPSLEAIPNVFVGVSPRQLHEAMDAFDVFDVYQGERLIRQGEKQPALVMVLRGTLGIEQHGRHRRAPGGSVLGLTTLFGDGVWPMGLKTLTDCRLMVLRVERYRQLRQVGSVVCQALEEYALEQLLQQLERTSKDVGAYLGKQAMDDLVPKPGFFERVSAAIGGGGIAVVQRDKARDLAASPLFRNAQPEQLAAIGARMEAIRANTGEFLLTEGEPSSNLYVVVEGAVAVIRSSGDRAAIKHQTLCAGDAFGVWSMLRTTENWASYVATQKSILLEMDKLTWTELSTGGDAIGSVLRLAAIRALTTRVSHAGNQLAAQALGLQPTLEESGEAQTHFVTINPATRR